LLLALPLLSSPPLLLSLQPPLAVPLPLSFKLLLMLFPQSPLSTPLLWSWPCLLRLSSLLALSSSFVPLYLPLMPPCPYLLPPVLLLLSLSMPLVDLCVIAAAYTVPASDATAVAVSIATVTVGSTAAVPADTTAIYNVATSHTETIEDASTAIGSATAVATVFDVMSATTDFPVTVVSAPTNVDAATLLSSLWSAIPQVGVLLVKWCSCCYPHRRCFYRLRRSYHCRFS
jgi:hypothetical protein